MNNNNIPYPNDLPTGRRNEGIDIQAPNPIIRDTKDKLYNDAQPPLEGAAQPAINTNSNIPSINYGTVLTPQGEVCQYDQRSGGYIPANTAPSLRNGVNDVSVPDGGTVLSDTTFSYGDYGVVEVNNMSTNTTDQWEAQMRAARRDATQGKSRYNTPVTQTPSVAPNIQEPPKPSEAQLSQLRKRDRLVNLNSRLKTLVHERQVASLKLAAIDRNIKSLEEELDSLDGKSV